MADDQPVLSLLTPEQQAILALQPQPEVPPKKATAGRKRKAVGDAFVTVARKMIRAGKPEHKRAALAMVQGVAKEVSESLGIAEEKISSAALQGTSLRGIHRVRRGPKISDAELSQRLDGVTVPSAQWSRRIGKCVRTLQGSKQRCYKDLKKQSSERGQAFLSYPQFCRRIAHGKLGIGTRRRRTDICPICHDWERNTAPLLRKTYGDIKTMLNAKIPGFWNTMPAVPDGQDELEVCDAASPITAPEN